MAKLPPTPSGNYARKLDDHRDESTPRSESCREQESEKHSSPPVQINTSQNGLFCIDRTTICKGLLPDPPQSKNWKRRVKRVFQAAGKTVKRAVQAYGQLQAADGLLKALGDFIKIALEWCGF